MRKFPGLQETEFNEYMLVGLGFGLASIVAIGMMIYCRKYKYLVNNMLSCHHVINMICLLTICHLCTMSHTLLRSMGWQGNIYRVSLKKGTFLIFCVISVLEVGFYFFTCVLESEF